jgi:hypothetical protein
MKKINLKKEWFKIKQIRNKTAHVSPYERDKEFDKLVKIVEKKLEECDEVFIFTQKDRFKTYFLNTFSPKMLRSPKRKESNDTSIETYLIGFTTQQLRKSNLIKDLVNDKYFHYTTSLNDYYRGHLTTDYALLNAIKNDPNQWGFLSPLTKELENAIRVITGLDNLNDKNVIEVINRRETILQQNRPSLHLKRGDIILIIPLGKTRHETELKMVEEVEQLLNDTSFIFLGFIE